MEASLLLLTARIPERKTQIANLVNWILGVKEEQEKTILEEDVSLLHGDSGVEVRASPGNLDRRVTSGFSA